jgi:hypothetical protein
VINVNVIILQSTTSLVLQKHLYTDDDADDNDADEAVAAPTSSSQPHQESI